MSTGLILLPTAASLPVPAVFAGPAQAERRFWEFFTTQISNDNTRKSYFNAVRFFSAWCQSRNIGELRHVEPMHVAAYLKVLEKEGLSAPSIKLHLAALRMLFDWLVVGQVIPLNPAHAVHGPKHSVRKGKTPVLAAEEARALLDSIIPKDTEGNEVPRLVDLRDRALIGLMVYTFARVNAAITMRVEDYFAQGRRGWVNLHEKGGKLHSLPCHHNLDVYLEAYIAKAGIAADGKGFLFRTAVNRAGDELTENALWQQDAYRMIQRRARAAGIKTRIGNHSFRATGITAYLKNGGRLEIAQQMANHESARTTGLYDRRDDEITLDEVERVGI
jgi:site-specific recombinase XerD